MRRRFLRWALETAEPTERRLLRAELRQRLEQELSEYPVERTSANELDVRAHGLLPASERARVRRAALHDVVLPCAEALGIEPEARAA
jgi:hypothetical protein